MNLPTGTVTFLFTDIEGSTRLWEERPEAMRRALAQHDDIVRQAVERHGGSVFKTMGDAFFAAFTTAPDAAAAALCAQVALQAAFDNQPVRIAVRMAVHTGAAELREDDYFGPPLNRVARLLSAGHGGQVLVSGATKDLAVDDLPAGASLKPLGAHRLRDLTRPEEVFQLVCPDLPEDFPALRSLDNPALPHNLPVQLTSFIGREKEIAEVKSLLAKTRLLTLTGSGGCGKTRLALQVAADMLEHYPDGVWLVELAPLADPELVPQTVSQALGVREEPGKPIVHALLDYLKSRKLLLLLDNCEHLLAACAQLADQALRASPDLRILASSREGLGVTGEQTYRVPSLGIPEATGNATPESVAHYEAVRLFIERALLSQPSFALSPSNATAVASVCRRLDGMPLAIELASARLKSLSVEEINARLDQRFRLLTGGSRTALPRQQTLRALIDWSYGLLNEQEKLLFRRLSVFSGGWTLEAAEKACSGDGLEDWETLDVLTSLVEKSLVVANVSEDQTRYFLLETVRQYGRDRLLESAEGIEVRNRHRDFFLSLAEEAWTARHGHLEDASWLMRMEREHDNLRAALEWCQDADDGAMAGLRITAAMYAFWFSRGYLTEGSQRVTQALACAEALGPTVERARALGVAAWLAHHQGDYAGARFHRKEALAIWKQRGDADAVVYTLGALAMTLMCEGDYGSARTLLQDTLARAQELRSKFQIAQALNRMGIAAEYEGDYALARRYYEQAMELTQEVGGTFQPELEQMHVVGDRFQVAWALHGIGFVACRQGDLDHSRALLSESLRLFLGLENPNGILRSLDRFGALAVVEGQMERAARLLAAADAGRRAQGRQMPKPEQDDWNRDFDAARAALGEEAFSSAWAAGQDMSIQQAVALALAAAP